MMEKILRKDCELQIKDVDTEKGVVTIYINAFNNKDSDEDISLPGSFKRTFKNNLKNFQHWLNHERNFFLGFPLELKEDDVGAIAVSQMNIKKQFVKDVFEDYRILAANGRTLQHSVRVEPIKFEEDRTGGEYIRRVSEWKLIMEYSTLYGWGANQNTPLIDIKEMKDLEIMMREGNYSDEKAQLIEETYSKLKQLIDSQDTPPGDPPALDDIQKFYSLIKI